MENGYVVPSLAENQLRIAEKSRQTVYIFGMCGYGKTSLIRNHFNETEYLYYDMFSDPYALLDFEPKKKAIIVIDNLGFLDDNSIEAKIIELIRNPFCWCILISRAKCPEWLITPSPGFGGLSIISDKDLALSLDETSTLLSIHGVNDIDDTNLNNLHEYTGGHPLYTIYIANRMFSSKTFEFNDTIIEGARKLLGDHLDHELLDRWNENLIDFAIKMSIVPSFTLPLAVEITNVNNIEALIAESNKIGDFLNYEEGVYSVVDPLKRYLNSKMFSLYSREKINDLYNNAGNYYKRHKRTLDAYNMFEKAGNKSQMLDILIENARLNPADGYLTELKNAYLTLDEDTITEHPELIAAICLIYSLSLDIDTSEYWYSVLCEKAETLTGKPQKVAKRYITYLDVACIHKPSKNILQILKNTASTVFDKSIIVPEWALTGNGPTIMNGGRDFCEWSKKDTGLYSTLAAPFRKIFGKSSAGMPELSLAESYLEKGESDYEIMRLVSKGQMDAEMRGRAELSFVAVGLLSQLHLIHGHIDDAVKLITDFKRNNPEVNPKLLQNVDTLLCRISLLSGDMKSVDKWLKTAPNENTDFNVLYRYMYMCKIRCYLAKNNYDAAHNLINKMMFYADLCERNFIKIECLLLLAQLENRQDNPAWKETLCSALELAEGYHFIRIISRESSALIDMIKQCGYDFKDSEYKKNLLKEVEYIAQMYPAYMKKRQNEKTDILENALTILKLQAQGLSNDEIAKTLFISTNTVKYHCKENYRKLGVANRTAAIAEAKRRGLL